MTDRDESLEGRVARIEETMAKFTPADPLEMHALTLAVKELGAIAGGIKTVFDRIDAVDRKVDHNLEDVREVSRKARFKFTVFAVIVVLFAAGLYVSNSAARYNSCHLRNEQTQDQTEFILGLIQANRNNPNTPPDSPEKIAITNKFLQDTKPLNCNFLLGSLGDG